MRNLLVAQSGGPTAAINATVAGVVSCAVLSGKVDHIYGAVNGIEGVLAEKFLDLGKKLDSAEKISLLMQTPAAALGSCRYKLGDPFRQDHCQSSLAPRQQTHRPHRFLCSTLTSCLRYPSNHFRRYK